MSGLTIERARPEALAACFALLPNLASPDAVIFTARNADGSLAGAGGVLWRGWGEPAAMPAWVTVLPDCRRRGVGARLFDALSAVARDEHVDLVAVEPVDEDSVAAAFARQCGATVDHRHLFFEGDPRNFQASIGALTKRLAKHGRVPPGSRVIPLRAAPIEEVKWLIVREMVTAPPLVEDMLAKSLTSAPETAPIDLDRSCVLMVGTDVAGALLSRRLPDSGSAAIVCNVVAPRWRGGWANALLLDRFTQSAMQADCFRVAFDCADHVRDTIGLARRSKADEIAVRTRFRYAAAAETAALRR